MANRQDEEIKLLTINCNSNLKLKTKFKIKHPCLSVNGTLREEVHAVIEEVSPDIVFGQELTNKYKTKSTKLSKYSPEGYEACNTEKQAAVLWKNKFDLKKEFSEAEKKNAQDQVRSESTDRLNPRSAAELYSRSCAVLLEINGSKILAISWHGPHKASNTMKQHTLAFLQKFAVKLSNQVKTPQESIPIIIGGDFNYDMIKVKSFENGLEFVSYERSPRREGLNLIDGFIIYRVPNAKNTKVVSMKDPLLDHDPVTTSCVLRTQIIPEE